MTHGGISQGRTHRPSVGGVREETIVSDIKTTPRRSDRRTGNRERILLMSENERRQKAADILAAGLIKLLQGSKPANDDREVPHEQG